MKLIEYEPDYAIHPGKTLKEVLAEKGILPKEFAVRTGKPIKTISNLLNGKTGVTPDMAVQFEKVLNIPANFWLKLQSEYEEFLARSREKGELQKATEWAKKFPYAAMAKYGWVKPTRKPSVKAEQLFAFFGISKVKAWEDIYLNNALPVFFRISLKRQKDPYALSAWLAKGEQIAKSVNCEPYSKYGLKEFLPELKSLMVNKPYDFFRQAQKLFLTAGVKLIYVPSLPKIPINGVVRWIGENPVVQIYDRYKRYDIFWFSLFHELGHILLHGKKKSIFLEDLTYLKNENREEKEANNFASKWLLPEQEFKVILEHLKKGNETLKVILESAKVFNTHPDIIIGKLLHENKNLYKNSLLQKRLSKINIDSQPKLF